jgi:hypothetical protein
MIKTTTMMKKLSLSMMLFFVVTVIAQSAKADLTILLVNDNDYAPEWFSPL